MRPVPGKAKGPFLLQCERRGAEKVFPRGKKVVGVKIPTLSNGKTFFFSMRPFL
jgi:hypothetical protein